VLSLSPSLQRVLVIEARRGALLVQEVGNVSSVMAASLNGEDYPAALGLHHHNPGTPKRLLEASYRIDKFELGSEGELFRHSHCRVSLLVRVDPNDREPSGTCLTFLAALFFIRWLLLP